MDTAERALLEATVREAIADARDGGRPVDAVLADLGWAEMLESEPRDAIGIVFTTLGAVNGTATILDDVVIRALGREPRPEVAVLLPGFGTWEHPGAIDNTRVRATGLTTSRLDTADELVVVCRDRSELHLAVVPASAAEVTPVRGIDPDARLRRVRLEISIATSRPADPGAWDAAIAAGRRAVAHQIVGACRTMLALARAHAIERVQFDRPIAQFQAVRHRLAEALVAVAASEASVHAAWDEAGPLTAALAKAVAGRTVRTVGAHCQQVLAGTGFTTDHPFHRFLKRAVVLEGVFGSADRITIDLGHHVLAARSVPTLIEL
jgi:hypothetical protein